jgi:hypothetical protein
MRTPILMLILFLMMGVKFSEAAKTRFFICTSTNSKEGAAYLAYFESKVFNGLKKDFPCVEISSQSTIAAILDLERMRQLLGSEERDLSSIGEAMGSDYLVSLKVRVMQGQVLVDAFCADTRKSKVISRAAETVSGAAAGLDAVERVSKQLVEGLKQYEICPFKGTINVTVKTERTDQKVESHAVFCNGAQGLYRLETNINNNSDVKWKLNKTGKYTTGGTVTYRLYEEMTIEEQNDCYPCPGGRQAPHMYNEKAIKRANVEGLSNESVSEGIQIDDARTTITFNEDGTYTIKVEAASRKGDSKKKTERKSQGSCDNDSKTDNDDKKVDVPLFEIFGPFEGTSLDKVLSESDTNVREDPTIKEKTTITFDFNLTK